jgi:hypothetical protein
MEPGTGCVELLITYPDGSRGRVAAPLDMSFSGEEWHVWANDGREGSVCKSPYLACAVLSFCAAELGTEGSGQ